MIGGREKEAARGGESFGVDSDGSGVREFWVGRVTQEDERGSILGGGQYRLGTKVDTLGAINRSKFLVKRANYNRSLRRFSLYPSEEHAVSKWDDRRCFGW